MIGCRCVKYPEVNALTSACTLTSLSSAGDRHRERSVDAAGSEPRCSVGRGGRCAGHAVRGAERRAAGSEPAGGEARRIPPGADLFMRCDMHFVIAGKAQTCSCQASCALHNGPRDWGCQEMFSSCQQYQLLSRSQSLVQDAIFGRPSQPGAGTAPSRRSQLNGHSQVCTSTLMRLFNCVIRCLKVSANGTDCACAQGADHDEDSDDAPVIVDATELGAQADVQPVVTTEAAAAAPGPQPVMSWREKALLLRQQRQA